MITEKDMKLDKEYYEIDIEKFLDGLKYRSEHIRELYTSYDEAYANAKHMASKISENEKSKTNIFIRNVRKIINDYNEEDKEYGMLSVIIHDARLFYIKYHYEIMINDKKVCSGVDDDKDHVIDSQKYWLGNRDDVMTVIFEEWKFDIGNDHWYRTENVEKITIMLE